jgi:redox-sensitive bicupin YhaK (pirin superfamily)
MEVPMTALRRIDRIVTPPPVGPGFAGPRHTARLIVPPGDFAATNPFFLMADDYTKVGGEFGEAHPHAGLETVTFMLSGSFEDFEGRLDPGDVEWMTSGRGIVHGKDTVTSNDMRLFQLWIALPEDERQSSPRVQRLRQRNMPVRKEPGAEARVYSGRSGDAVAKTMNAAPVTLVDVRLEPNASFEQDLPASYNGFIVVIAGAVSAGDPAKTLAKDQVGWLDRPTGDGESALRLGAAGAPARVLIYAGEPQEMRLAARGPFIAGSDGELAGYFAAYRRGEFPLASSLRQEVG